MKYLHPFFWALACLAAGMSASLLQADALRDWYPFLDKSSLTPPGWVFPPVWAVLYLLMGFSIGLVRQTLRPERRFLTLLFILQLGFNILWTMAFFWLRDPVDGLVCISFLVPLLCLYVWKSWPVSRVAAWLFAPYLAWATFAWYLNAHIAFNN